MNSFLELHISSDYLNSNRQYFTGIWERTITASDYAIPFQLTELPSDLTIYKVNTAGAETDITSYFRSLNKLNDWALTGTGPFDNSGASILSWTIEDSDFITSNQFALTAGQISIDIDDGEFGITPGDIDVYLLKGAATIWSGTIEDFDETIYINIATAGSDYTIKIENDSGFAYTAGESTPSVKQLNIVTSGGYSWYPGTQLSYALTGIYRLKITGLATTYYSDYLEACGFSGKLKYLVESSYDFGSIKYAGGYQQWIYKNANVRRSPRGQIETIADQLNGKLINEKVITAVRYVIKMKVTESEYEAFIHSIGGTVTITDPTGKTFNAVNIEITDPVWYRSNGIVELSFVDENNINVWTRNNTTL